MSKQKNETPPPPPSTVSEGLISRVAKAIVGPKACKVKVGEYFLTEAGQAGFEYEGKVFEYEKDAKEAFASFASRNASWSGEPEFVLVGE